MARVVERRSAGVVGRDRAGVSRWAGDQADHPSTHHRPGRRSGDRQGGQSPGLREPFDDRCGTAEQDIRRVAAFHQPRQVVARREDEPFQPDRPCRRGAGVRLDPAAKSDSIRFRSLEGQVVAMTRRSPAARSQPGRAATRHARPRIRPRTRRTGLRPRTQAIVNGLEWACETVIVGCSSSTDPLPAAIRSPPVVPATGRTACPA